MQNKLRMLNHLISFSYFNVWFHPFVLVFCISLINLNDSYVSMKRLRIKSILKIEPLSKVFGVLRVRPTVK